VLGDGDTDAGEGVLHADDVGVARDTTAVAQDERVRGTDGLRHGREDVGDGERDLFERHGEREPRPVVVETVEEGGETVLIAFVARIRPVREPSRRVSRIVDDGRQ
jgi:hypothetical protein